VVAGAGDSVHLGADLVEKAHAVTLSVCGISLRHVEIEVGSILYVSEFGIGVEAVQNSIEAECNRQ